MSASTIPTNGIAARLRARAQLDPARIPALGPVLRDAADKLSAGLSALIGTDAIVSVERTAAAIDDFALRALGHHRRAAFTRSDVPGEMLLAIGRTSLDLVTDILFGGDGHDLTADPSRAATALDCSVSRRLFAAVATAMAAGFGDSWPEGLTPASEDGGSAGDEPRVGAWVLVDFKAVVAAREWALPVLLPQPWLAALEKRLVEPNATPVGEDPVWTARLREEIGQTALPVRAVIEEPGMTLADVLRLRVGAMLPLRATAHSPVDLVCGGASMLTGELGQRDGGYTVRIGTAARS